MSLLSPLAAMLIALGTPQGTGSDMAARHTQDSEAGSDDLKALSARRPAWRGFVDTTIIPIVNQVRIERRVIMRVSPRPSSISRSMLSELPQQAVPPRLVERPHGKCVDAGDIVGVSDRGSRLMMYMRGRHIISAELEKSCSPRDFYLGFYVERSEDGKLCVDRDRLMSRAGAKCRISHFSRLVAVGGDR